MLCLDCAQHGQRVRGVDWAPKSNKIVTCGDVSLAASYILLVLHCGIVSGLDMGRTEAKMSEQRGKLSVGDGA